MASCKYRFSVVPGFFNDYKKAAERCPKSKLTRQPALGLLERAYDTDAKPVDDRSLWTRFASFVEALNHDSRPGESYKVLHLVRHGVSVHNVVMEKVGSAAWNSHWSHLDGDGTLTWVDAKVVDQGISQAEDLSNFWIAASRDDGVPLPSILYTSPLARCLEFTKLVYGPVMQRSNLSFAPIVKEGLRERLTDHTCDKRSSRSWISANYPEYILEPSFTEADELWQADRWESDADHQARAQTVLEEVFKNDAASFISLTTHSYAISAILSVIGAEVFRVSEGAIVTLLVKGVRLVSDGL
ncbi:histidine phosphatase superfamily [Nemania sp. NC0429]|nr:histidine phosphatase superfamily [Nemania sp. NC0429]